MSSYSVSRRAVLGSLGGAATAALTAALPLQANAAEPGGDGVIHVATHGSDSNPGTKNRPFRTIAAGYAHAEPGETVLVEPGVYKEEGELDLNRAGTADEPIIVRSRVKWGAVLENPDVEKMVRVSADHNVIQDFEMRGSLACGVYVYTGNYTQVLGNWMHHLGNNPRIEPWGQEAILSENRTWGHTYASNLIHHIGRPRSVEPHLDVDHGMYLCADDELVMNNVCAYNRDNGIQVAGYSTVSNMRLYNNVLARNGHSGIVFWQPIENIEVVNNIFYENGRDPFERDGVTYSHPGIFFLDAPGTIEIRNNDFYGNPEGPIAEWLYKWVPPTNNAVISGVMEFDPLFVDPDDVNFRLRGNSPAIDAGVPLEEVVEDLSGRSRPRGKALDLGAYEKR